MVESSHNYLSISAQCRLLQISRSAYYYAPASETDYNLFLMQLIDAEFLKYPFFGSRQMRMHLARMNHFVSRHRVRRLMKKMGLTAIYQKRKTSQPDRSHKIYPYLLKNLNINKPRQVWCSDITYLPLKKGFMYLVAVQDWYSRQILSWRLSNTMDTGFCIAALEDAIAKYSRPDIFNTDQGSQYTSIDFTTLLKDHGIKISMDGKGRWMDNVFIERVWRSLKYECVYLQEFDDALQLKNAIDSWFEFYNHKRPHSSFRGKTPSEIYREILPIEGSATVA